MKSVLMSAAAAVALVGFVGVSAVTASPTITSSIPETVADFQLTDNTRLAHELYYFKYAPAIVLMSQTNGSKISRDAASELAKLQAA